MGHARKQVRRDPGRSRGAACFSPPMGQRRHANCGSQRHGQTSRPARSSTRGGEGGSFVGQEGRPSVPGSSGELEVQWFGRRLAVPACRWSEVRAASRRLSGDVSERWAVEFRRSVCCRNGESSAGAPPVCAGIIDYTSYSTPRRDKPSRHVRCFREGDGHVGPGQFSGVSSTRMMIN